jgi:hypothetical protein
VGGLTIERLFASITVACTIFTASPAWSGQTTGYNYHRFRNEIENTLQVADNIHSTGEGLYSPNMVRLLLETAAVESDFGRQLEGNADSVGAFQIQVKTLKDMGEHFFIYKAGRILKRKLDLFRQCDTYEQELRLNRTFNIVAAAIHYRRVLRGKKVYNGIWNRARIWKKYFNTKHGAGTVEKYIEKSGRYLPKHP